MPRSKTTTRKRVVKNKVDKGNGISKPTNVREKAKVVPALVQVETRLRNRQIIVVQPTTLDAFSVTWRPNPTNGPTQVGFRLAIRATFSEPVDQARIGFAQYTRDRLSIAAGTDPGNVQFKTTRFELDRYDATYEIGDVASDGVFQFADNPGYTQIFGLDGTSDLHYTFGAYWIIRLDGAEVLNTSAYPLFGTAVGTGLRGFTPSNARTARYNLVLGDWNNAGPLIRQWPALPPAYPVPAVTDP